MRMTASSSRFVPMLPKVRLIILILVDAAVLLIAYLSVPWYYSKLAAV